MNGGSMADDIEGGAASVTQHPPALDDRPHSGVDNHRNQVPTAAAPSRTQQKLRVRFAAGDEDVARTRVLSLEAHEEGRFRSTPFSMDKRGHFIRNAITTPQWRAVIVAEIGEQPVGFIVCSVGEHILGTSAMVSAMDEFDARSSKLLVDSLINRSGSIRIRPWRGRIPSGFQFASSH